MIYLEDNTNDYIGYYPDDDEPDYIFDEEDIDIDNIHIEDDDYDFIEDDYY